MPEIKTLDQLQWAHDVLYALINGTVPVHVSGEIRDQMLIAMSVLCWALGHTNDVFAINLAKCEEQIAKSGTSLLGSHKAETVH